jgi:hypothetical protein
MLPGQDRTGKISAPGPGGPVTRNPAVGPHRLHHRHGDAAVTVPPESAPASPVRCASRLPSPPRQTSPPAATGATFPSPSRSIQGGGPTPVGPVGGHADGHAKRMPSADLGEATGRCLAGPGSSWQLPRRAWTGSYPGPVHSRGGKLTPAPEERLGRAPAGAGGRRAAGPPSAARLPPVRSAGGGGGRRSRLADHGSTVS